MCHNSDLVPAHVTVCVKVCVSKATTMCNWLGVAGIGWKFTMSAPPFRESSSANVPQRLAATPREMHTVFSRG